MSEEKNAIRTFMRRIPPMALVSERYGDIKVVDANSADYAVSILKRFKEEYFA